MKRQTWKFFQAASSMAFCCGGVIVSSCVKSLLAFLVCLGFADTVVGKFYVESIT